MASGGRGHIRLVSRSPSPDLRPARISRDERELRPASLTQARVLRPQDWRGQVLLHTQREQESLLE